MAMKGFILISCGLWLMIGSSDGYNISSLKKINSNAIRKTGQRYSIADHADILEKLKAGLCPSNQTIREPCVGFCCPDYIIKVIEDEEFTRHNSSDFKMVCHSDEHIAIIWKHNITEKSLFLLEVNPVSRNDTPKTYVVTDQSYAVITNLTANTKYNICVVNFKQSYFLGKNLGCNEFYTLPENHTIGNIPKIWLVRMSYISFDNLEADIKWAPGPDSSCYYDVILWFESDVLYEIEVEVPMNFYNVSMTELRYNSTYNIAIRGTTKNKSREGTISWFTIKTPDCLAVHSSTDICAPAKPSNVTVVEKMSKSHKGNYYDITMRWKIPRFRPRKYTINITSYDSNQQIASQVIMGDQNQAFFEDVQLGFAYEISMDAHSRGGTSQPIKLYRKLTNQNGETSYYRSILWSILTPLFILACIVSTLALYRYRSKKLMERRYRYIEEYDKKLPKKIDCEFELPVELEADPLELTTGSVILSEILGEGAFGIVRRGHMADRTREVAVKMLKDETFSGEVKQFKQEIEMMKLVGTHPHIVSLIGYCTRPNTCMMLVVEYCPLGDLLHYLRAAWKDLVYQSLEEWPSSSNKDDDAGFTEKLHYAALIKSENSDNHRHNFVVNKLYDQQRSELKCKTSNLSYVDLLSFSRQIAMGMEYLSSNKVVHRDLAARNVLVCNDKTVKISDFGLSRDIYNENIYKKMGSGKLPIKWMALESLSHQVYTTQSDVWSFGILLWEIVTMGGSPYPSIPSNKLLSMLMDGYRMQRPLNCSGELYELMLACWDVHPKERPNFTDIREIIDKLLDGICSDAYLTLDISNYKQLSDLERFKTDQSTSFEGSNGSEVRSDRYVEPIKSAKLDD